MISANEACQIAVAKVNSEKNSSHYNFAMKKIEDYIKDAANRGCRSFCYNLLALEYNDNFPSKALREAIKSELCKHGYSYFESTNYRNNCFQVSW